MDFTGKPYTGSKSRLFFGRVQALFDPLFTAFSALTLQFLSDLLSHSAQGSIGRNRPRQMILLKTGFHAVPI